MDTKVRHKTLPESQKPFIWILIYCYPFHLPKGKYYLLLVQLLSCVWHIVTHGLQHTKPPYSSLSPGVCPSSGPSYWWCCPTISSSVIPVFSCQSVVCIEWPKFWSFSISPSNEYVELISFWIDWFDPFAVQGTLKRVFSSTIAQKCSQAKIHLNHAEGLQVNSEA